MVLATGINPYSFVSFSAIHTVPGSLSESTGFDPALSFGFRLINIPS